MRTLFTTGIVDTTPAPPFTVAVLTGTAGWVGLATAARLPVSTTHALVGALLGAGLLAAPHAVHWPALAGKVAIPLLGSAVVAYLGSALLDAVLRWRAGRQPEGLRAMVLPLPGIAGLGERTLTGVHWASAGLVGAARGLNDTPKLAAVAGSRCSPPGFRPSLSSSVSW